MAPDITFPQEIYPIWGVKSLRETPTRADYPERGLADIGRVAGQGAAMKIRLALIGALALFDLVVAVLTSLGLISPQAAVGLLLTNPLVVIIDHQLRARR